MATDTTTQINRPAPFIETMGKTFGEGLTRLAAKPLDTTQVQPSVAYQGALGQAGQQAAASQAGLGNLTFDASTGAVTGVGAGSGIAGYQPYLNAATALGGTGAGTGAGSIASYQNPYTEQVITATQDQMLQEHQRANNQRAAQAVGAGAFGGARSGIEQAIADEQYNMQAAMMGAGLRQQGFGQAQQARQQDLMNQMNFAQAQPQLAQQNIQGIMGLGQQDQTYRQAIADTTAAQNQLAAFEPYQRYGFFGENLTGLMGGYPGGTRMTQQPSASPMSQALGMGIAGGLGYAGMKQMGMFGG